MGQLLISWGWSFGDSHVHLKRLSSYAIASAKGSRIGGGVMSLAL